MSERLALIGGEEFSPGFEAVHAELAVHCGGSCRVVFLPTPAADDGPEVVAHWSTLAREKLGALGVLVETPPVVDPASANEARYARLVAEADWIYLGGGYPHVAMRILAGSSVLHALQDAAKRGALISGASGGAMLMAARAWVMTPELVAEVGRYWESGTPADWEPPVMPLIEGLSLLPCSLVAPHFNRIFSRVWAEPGYLPDGYNLIGIDEQTALVKLGDTWRVHGQGQLTIMRPGADPERYSAGDTVEHDRLLCWASVPLQMSVERSMVAQPVAV